MAISAVKATKATASSGTSVTMTSLTATAGSALLVGASGYENTTTGGSFASVTRTGDTFTIDTEGNTSASVDIQRIGIASAPNVGASAQNLVVTINSAQGVVAFALEVSGLPTSSIRDATSPAIAIGTGTAAVSNSLTNATADAIYFAMAGTERGGASVTITPGASWTDTVGGTTMKETNANSFPASGAGYQIVASAASRTADWTFQSADWGVVIAVYKAAASAGLPPGLNGDLEMGTMAQAINAVMARF